MTVNIYSPQCRLPKSGMVKKLTAGQLIVLVEKAHDINAKMHKSDIGFLSVHPATTESVDPNISDERFCKFPAGPRPQSHRLGAAG